MNPLVLQIIRIELFTTHFIILFCFPSGFDLWFRTTTWNGLLVFAATQGQEEFIALQLNVRRPWLLFDPQGKIWPSMVKLNLRLIILVDINIHVRDETNIRAIPKDSYIHSIGTC